MGSLRAVDEALPTAGDKRPRNEDESQVECIEEDQMTALVERLCKKALSAIQRVGHAHETKPWIEVEESMSKEAALCLCADLHLVKGNAALAYLLLFTSNAFQISCALNVLGSQIRRR